MGPRAALYPCGKYHPPPGFDPPARLAPGESLYPGPKSQLSVHLIVSEGQCDLALLMADKNVCKAVQFKISWKSVCFFWVHVKLERNIICGILFKYILKTMQNSMLFQRAPLGIEKQ